MTLEQMAKVICKNFLKNWWEADWGHNRPKSFSEYLSKQIVSTPYEILTSPNGIYLLKEAVEKLKVDYSIIHYAAPESVMGYRVIIDANGCSERHKTEADALIDGVYHYLELRGQL